MNLVLSKRQRKAIYADLKTEFLYIAIPFCLLIGVKIYMGSWREIFMTADWALASCIIFGQITSKVSKAVANSKLVTSQEHFGLYTAKRFFLVIAASAVYFGMLVLPSIQLGIFQICLFLVASYFHFSDGYATAMLQAAYNKALKSDS
ncbi:hypothetical protein ABMY35_20200 [Pseudoalteromonas sp. BZB3]|uniref:hypothetical protein n=1 Tax=Pseudoalteromonas sp. BZB3 TaxID=3136670 RepID=UPI0032C40ECF